MKIQASGEDYLEAILILQKQMGDYLNMDNEGFFHLTNSEKEIEEKIYEKPLFLTGMLVNAGVSKEVAERKGCRRKAQR